MVRFMSAVCGFLLIASIAFADENFDKLFKSGKYKEAIDYADESIPPPSRTPDIWVSLAKANESLGLVEKALACYLVSSRVNNKDYESFLGAARIYNKLGQPDNALTTAQKALDINFTGEASWEYAAACIKLNRSTEAKKALEKVIETDPTNAVANRELGNIYFASKEYDKAVPLLKKSYDKKPDADIAYKLGKASLETNDLPGATENLKNVLKADPTMNNARLDLARTYYKLGDYSNAANEFDKVLSKVSATGMDYYALAICKDKGNDTKGSVAAYESAVKTFGASKQSEALASRLIVGKAQLERKDFSGAVANFKFIANADPKNETAPDISFLIVDADVGLNALADAVSVMEGAIVKNAKNIEAYARLADLYKQTGADDKARATYEKMISLSPSDPAVYIILGQYNNKIKSFQKALEMFLKADNLKRSAASCEGIALASAGLGNWDAALEAAKTALSLDGSLLSVQGVLATGYLKSQDYRNAIPALEALAKANPSNKEYLVNLATCYDKTQNIEKLADADKRLLNLDKSNIVSRLRYAKYAVDKKDSKSAYAIYKELSVLDPKNPDVQKNLYTLASAENDKANAFAYLDKYLALNPSDANAQRDMGDFLYEKKDLDGSLKAYREALRLDPTIKGFYKRYAEIVIAKGQFDEAIKAISGKIKSGEATAEDYNTLGMIYQKKGNYQSAMTSFEKVLQLDSKNTDALIALAETQALAGSINEAIITYEQVIMMSASASKEYKSLGDLYVKQNKNEQATKAYKKYLEKNPTDTKMAMQIGLAASSAKMYDDAAKFLVMAKSAAEPEDARFFFLLGEAYYNIKDSKNAIATFEAIRKGGPKLTAKAAAYNKSILRMLGESYEKNNQLDKAAEVYAVYIKIEGVRDGEASYKVAFLQEKSSPVVAKKIYEENIVKFPKDYRNFLQLGMMYANDKATLAKAVSVFGKITTMADSIPAIWGKLGEVYGKLGNDDEEFNAYKSLIKSDPQNILANKRVGLILVKKGKLKEGLIYLETATTLSPKDPDILYGLAESYAKTDRPNEAINALNRAKNILPKDVKIRMQLYKLYIKADKPKDARKEVEELLALNPTDNDTRLMYAQMLFEDKKYKEADNEIENIMASSPSAKALVLMGKVKEGLKDYKGSLEAYESIFSLGEEYTNYAPALYGKAELFRVYGKELGKSPKWAETFYERALKADPKFALAELGIARLQKMWKRDDLYKKHLDAAKLIDPTNPEILAEISSGGK